MLGEGKAIIVTGFSAYNELGQFLSELSAKTGLSLDVVAVKNNLFGPSVTVTGLVAGRDIIKALDGAESGALIVIPDVMLKEGEGVFLDDLTTGDIERALNVRTLVVESSPQGLYAGLKRQFLKKGNKNK
jgi:NifB/MoaA-like Fe-S oxidoreductase